MNPGRISPGAWLMVVLVYIWDIIMTGHMEVLQLAAQYHRKKHRVESEDTKRRSRDMINEKKDKFASYSKCFINQGKAVVHSEVIGRPANSFIAPMYTRMQETLTH